MNKDKRNELFEQASMGFNSYLAKQAISDKLKQTNLFTKEEKYLIEQALIAFKG